jgi:hypothetical protein
MTEVWTPQRAANRLAKLAEVFSAAHGVHRFPVMCRHLLWRLPASSAGPIRSPRETLIKATLSGFFVPEVVFAKFASS